MMAYYKKKKKLLLPGGESNPGLPRDRRGYLPLYYRGVVKFGDFLLYKEMYNGPYIPKTIFEKGF